ncbi:hypothetical protein E4U42_006756 [Claviceps africana]|uniref:Major facilitator superfamily (MFS) profile domain-containing protein n=1 Tax=Claviceps africana TaxID=83212 RepID=A0A8K0NGI5_9HYPO|nr:hypothetical protein E4U42_006756 [Claviceps africana]
MAKATGTASARGAGVDGARNGLVDDSSQHDEKKASQPQPQPQPQPEPRGHQVGHDVEDAAASASHAPSEETSPEAAAAAAAAEPEAERTPLETFLVVFALCLSLFLAALDMTIITTALPTIASRFNSSEGYLWIGSSYLLGTAIFSPVWGKISDIFGRKPVLIGAVAIFFLGSLLCALSNSMGLLIAARAIQGVGGGGAIVLPNICISDLFSMRRRGMYFGMLGGVWAAASALGPVLGGLFTSKASWRWCFYINLPLSGVVLAILVFVVKLHNPRTPVVEGLAAIDWLGGLLVVGGTLMLLLGLEFGGVQLPWASAPVICLIVFGFVTLGLFVAYEARGARYAIIPTSLFRCKNSLAAFSIAFWHGFTYMGGSYWLPLYFQGVMAASSLLSGIYILPYVFSLSCASATCGVLVKRTGNYKLPMVVCLAVMTLGFGLLIGLGDDRNWAKIIVFQMIAGLGVGPNFQAPLIALQTNVEPRDIGVATASFGFLRQLGSAVSVVLGGVIFNNRMQAQAGSLGARLDPHLAAMFTGSQAAASVHVVATLHGSDARVVEHAVWSALRGMYILFTCTALVSFILSFGITQTQLSKHHTEHKTGLQSLKQRSEAPGRADGDG